MCRSVRQGRTKTDTYGGEKRTLKRNLIVCVVAAAIIAMSAMLCSPAAADMSQTYDLKIFNNPAAALNPDLHYTVEVSDRDVLSGQARFTISNISTGGTSSIAEIYFDDGFLLDISRVDNGPGVSFAPDLSSAGNDVRPKNLPAGQDLHPPRHIGPRVDRVADHRDLAFQAQAGILGVQDDKHALSGLLCRGR